MGSKNQEFIFAKMVGQYRKNDYIIDSVNQSFKNAEHVNTAISMASAVPKLVTKGYNTLAGLGAINSPLAYSVVSDIGGLAKAAGTVGSVANVAGGVLSAAGLGTDIAKAVNDGKITFDTAMKMADDGTGIVSAIASGINPLAGLAVTGVEKLVTGVVKSVKAVEDEKKREGLKHLKPGVWMETVLEANAPAWMTADIGQSYKDWKAKAPERKAAKAQKKAEWKAMSGKEKAARFFFG
jgi:hypothetical protein